MKKRTIMLKFLVICFVLLAYHEVECNARLQETDIKNRIKKNINKSLNIRSMSEGRTEQNPPINTTQRMRKPGGDKVENSKQFPYITSIEKKVLDDYIVLCTGILLNTTHVLTTANCVSSNISDLEIHLGKSDVETEIRRQIIKVIYNPEHKNKSYLNIVLLEMDKPVNETSEIQSIKPSHFDEQSNNQLEELMAEGALCKAVEFGNNNLHGNDSDIIRSFNVSLVKWDVCTWLSSDANSQTQQVCAMSMINEDACNLGDGGALDCKGNVYGIFILNGSRDDCDYKPIVFTRLDSMIPLFNNYSENMENSHIILSREVVNETIDELVTPLIKLNDSSDAVIEPTIVLNIESKNDLTPTRQPLCETLRRPPPGVEKFICTNTAIGCCLDNCYKEFRKSDDDPFDEKENRDDEAANSAIPGFGDVATRVLFMTILINVLFINSNKLIL